jgi:hypothetical protein
MGATFDQVAPRRKALPEKPASEEAAADPRRQLLERVITSDHFSKSPQLVRFLSYVCEQSFVGDETYLSEQLVGNAVFGRALGYNSNEDNIVRAHASRLRQKLNSYFSQEGRSEPLVIVLPRGSYAPQFLKNPDLMEDGQHLGAMGVAVSSPQTVESIQEQPSDQPPVPQLKAFSRLGWFTAAGLAVVLAIFTAVGFATHSVMAPSQQPNHNLWAVLLGREDTIIVPGDSSLDIYNNVTGHTIGVAEYITGQYRSQPADQDSMTPAQLRILANRRLTSIVDLDVINGITRRTEATTRPLIIYARDLRMDNLKNSNVILIGSSEANPWVQLFESKLNFAIQPNQTTKLFTVTNRSPRQGEQQHYETDAGSQNHTAYALVACTHNLSGKGYVLLIEGTAMAGTQAAADFVLGNPELSRLVKTTGLSSEHIPEFEVLLETTNLNGNSASSKVIAYRANN